LAKFQFGLKIFRNKTAGKLLIDLSLPVSPAGWMLGIHRKNKNALKRKALLAINLEKL
jgi:hypothetical protein